MLDFVNTVDSRRDRWGPDALQTCGDLLEWMSRLELVSAGCSIRLAKLARAHPEEGREALDEAKALREAIYRVALCEISMSDADAADLKLIEDGAKRWAAAQKLTLSPSGAIVWSQEISHLSAITARLASSAVELFIAREHRRPIGECPGRDCGWLFIDHSKSGRRRWCSDETCGTSARVRKYRAKHS
ncbi:CGNR zinc finger domain-containing protein [Rhizobium deserti]|uniref:CGNR zinc finger domain-containing protein n=1 Tax=Rhizobium deserti TaxID=2547961 RepID=UPI003CCA98C6